MNKKIISFIKYNYVFYRLYRFVGNLFISILKIFVPVKNNRILFMSFGGQKFDDSPKVLYEEMMKDSFFDDYEFVWAFTNPKQHSIKRGKIIRVDSLKFYIYAISSPIWIDNSSIERGLKLERKNFIELNTWHGTPLKKMGKDINQNKGFKGLTYKKKRKTIYCSQSSFDQKIFARLFDTDIKNILISDLPRNDFLSHFNKNYVDSVKNKLGIPLEKKVILYAPTFREYQRDMYNSCFIEPPINVDKWAKALGDNYIVLFRAHYEIIKVFGLKSSSFMRDVSLYPILNDLLVISDILISDYSSIYFDFSILERPMLNFSFDLEEYRKVRGLYEESFNSLPCPIIKSEDDLLDFILKMDYEKMCNQSRIFKHKFAPKAGSACKIIISALKKALSF